MLARARLPCKKLSRKMRCCGKLAGDQWSPAIRQECNFLTVWASLAGEGFLEKRGRVCFLKKETAGCGS